MQAKQTTNRLRLTNSLSSVKGESTRQLPEVPTKPSLPHFTPSPSPFVRKQQALNNAGLRRRNRVNSCRSLSPVTATSTPGATNGSNPKWVTFEIRVT